MFITCDEQCFRIMSNMVELVSELESSQEEADTRMMLHLAHIYQDDFYCAVIASIDADMTFLCLANYHKFSMTLFQKCCSETRMKYVDIASIGNVLGKDVSEALKIQDFISLNVHKAAGPLYNYNILIAAHIRHLHKET